MYSFLPLVPARLVTPLSRWKEVALPRGRRVECDPANGGYSMVELTSTSPLNTFSPRLLQWTVGRGLMHWPHLCLAPSLIMRLGTCEVVKGRACLTSEAPMRLDI